MNLTKNDLQAIGNLIDERLEAKLEKKFEENLAPITATLSSHTVMLKKLEKKVNKIDWTVNYISKTFDERIIQNMKDIEKLKTHLSPSRKN